MSSFDAIYDDDIQFLGQNFDISIGVLSQFCDDFAIGMRISNKL